MGLYAFNPARQILPAKCDAFTAPAPLTSRMRYPRYGVSSCKTSDGVFRLSQHLLAKGERAFVTITGDNRCAGRAVHHQGVLILYIKPVPRRGRRKPVMEKINLDSVLYLSAGRELSDNIHLIAVCAHIIVRHDQGIPAIIEA